MDNLVIAALNNRTKYTTRAVFQYNRGMRLRIACPELPAYFRADFANSAQESSISAMGENNEVEIPYQFFVPGSKIHCWIVLTGDDYAVTKYHVVIPIDPRARPGDDEPTPEQRSALEEAIEALNEAAEGARNGKEAKDAMAGAFSEEEDYAAGDYVWYEGNLYQFTEAHPAGPWDETQAELARIVDELAEIRKWLSYGIVVPEMYGAKGDGVTDDTDAINAALAENRLVFLLPHTYRTTKPVYVPSYTSLIGMSREKSKIYNNGLGYMKNAVICGYIEGDTNHPHAIKNTDAIPYQKTGKYTFTCARTFRPDDIVHFKVPDEDDGVSQLLSTSTYITTADGITYTVFDPIPDGAELHAYSDASGEADGLICQTAFGTRVENFTIEHLPTGSGMYCLFVCGARQTVRRIRTIGNTGLATNLSVHSLWEDIECISYGDNLDCAEYVYNTVYRNISVRKSSIDASTMHTQLAFGRGHDIRVERFTSNRANDLALTYARNVTFEECEMALSNIAQTGAGRGIVFRRCKLYSDGPLTLREADYENCYIQHPNPGVGIGHFSEVVSDESALSIVANSVIHKPGYKDQVFRRIVALSAYVIPKFDNSIWVRVMGSGLELSDGENAISADHELTVIITPGGLVRVAADGGAFTAPGWNAASDFTITGTLGYIEQDSLVGNVPV